MSTSPEILQIKQIASKLSPKELNHLVEWFFALSEKKQRDGKSDASRGIPPKSVLKAFQKTLPIRRGRICLTKPSHGAIAMHEFYKNTRVKNCEFDDGADMLLIQWGIDGKQPFISFTRQIIPPLTNVHDVQIWQLMLAFWYRPSNKLKGLPDGNRWFRSLHECEKNEAFIRFIHKLPIMAKFKDIEPSRITLTYDDVE